MNALHATQKPGWVARILLTLTTMALLVLGFFFLTVALVAGAILALVIGFRLWWSLRKLKQAQAGAGGSASGSAPGAADKHVVEGEYQVIERDTHAEKLPPQR